MTAGLHRRALRILVTGRLPRYPRGRRGSRLRAELERFARRHRRWLSSPAIQGFAFGPKRVHGHDTAVMALIIFVRRKQPRAKVRLPVPVRIRIPTLGTFVTDVVTVGSFRHHAGPPFIDTVRPLQPGTCLSVSNGAPGTLGCFVKKIGTNVPLILSCAHVLANDFLAGSSRTVEQTATRHQASNGGPYRIGAFLTMAPINFEDDINDFSNEVDAALASVDPAQLPVNPVMRETGLRPTVIGKTFNKDDVVRKVGFATNQTVGTIAVPEVIMSAHYPANSGGGPQVRAGYLKLVGCTYDAEEGDSGSLVVGAAGEALGLHIGSNDKFSLFCRFNTIAAKLGIVLY